MTEAEIEAFLTICRTKNITEAAEALYISQSSLSTRLKALEAEVGKTLFLRGKGQKRLTLAPAGTQLYPLAKQYLALLQQMRAIGSGPVHGPLRVSSINSLATCLLSPVYASFLQQNPQLDLEIQDMEAASAIPSIRRGRTDLALTAEPSKEDIVLSFPLFSERMVFACATSHPNPAAKELLDPANEVYISWSESFDQWHDSFWGRPAIPAVRLSVMEQLRFFLAQKGCWAVLPWSVGQFLSASGEIRTQAHEFGTPPRIIYGNCLAEQRTEPAIEAFLSCLKEALSQYSPGNLELLF